MLKRDFKASKPLEKCITDITEIPAKDRKLYVSAIFDCYDLKVLGIEMRDNMKADLCVQTLKNAYISTPGIRGCKMHSDQGKQYSSNVYRHQIKIYGIQ